MAHGLQAPRCWLNAAARAEELARVIGHAQCGFLIADGAHPEAVGLAGAVDSSVQIIARDAGRMSRPATELTLATEPGSDASALPDLEPSALASLIYTSGTTGAPKAVMLSHGNLASNAAAIVEYLDLRRTGQHGLRTSLPLFIWCLRAQHAPDGWWADLIIEPNLVFPHRVVETMARERCTGFAGVPSTFALLTARVALERYDLSSLRYITQAGGGMSPALSDRVRAAFPGARLFVMYGQTEASARLTWLPPEQLDEKRGSARSTTAGRGAADS